MDAELFPGERAEVATGAVHVPDRPDAAGLRTVRTPGGDDGGMGMHLCRAARRRPVRVRRAVAARLPRGAAGAAGVAGVRGTAPTELDLSGRPDITLRVGGR
ncbi:hypothetical protein ACVB8X_31670 [Streptomyces sp. NRAIS4]